MVHFVKYLLERDGCILASFRIYLFPFTINGFLYLIISVGKSMSEFQRTDVLFSHFVQVTQNIQIELLIKIPWNCDFVDQSSTSLSGSRLI